MLDKIEVPIEAIAAREILDSRDLTNVEPLIPCFVVEDFC